MLRDGGLNDIEVRVMGEWFGVGVKLGVVWGLGIREGMDWWQLGLGKG